MNAEKVILHAIVQGYVQGVGFRATTRYLALSFGLTGTVKNMDDGRVEIYVQGTKADVEKFIASLKDQFSASYVQNLATEYIDSQENYPDFRIIY